MARPPRPRYPIQTRHPLLPDADPRCRQRREQPRANGETHPRALDVENNIHWLRDAVGHEDRSRTHDPNAACVLALLRTALLAPVRAAGHLSLTQSMETFAKTPRRALAILLNQRLA